MQIRIWLLKIVYCVPDEDTKNYYLLYRCFRGKISRLQCIIQCKREVLPRKHRYFSTYHSDFLGKISFSTMICNYKLINITNGLYIHLYWSIILCVGLNSKMPCQWWFWQWHNTDCCIMKDEAARRPCITSLPFHEASLNVSLPIPSLSSYFNWNRNMTEMFTFYVQKKA
jgi:hypothetical protein